MTTHKTMIPLAVGQRIHTYELLEKLGEGGMGAVWKARHLKLDKLVALKLLRTQLTSDPETVRRFEREMRAVGKVEHPNVVRAMDAGEVEGLHYLVMEFVDGMDLSKYVKQHGPVSLADACRMLYQAALGLAAAHANGLVHRDIKPSNLLLTSHGEIKILDLGLARLLADGHEGRELTQMGDVFGTPDFMAPEQWDDTHNVDYRADIYALGCTLCVLLTGHAPFGGERHVTLTQKMRAHVMEAPPRLRDVRADVTEELENLYSQLMEKDAKRRLMSATEVAQRLQQISQGLSTMKSSLLEQDTVTTIYTSSAAASAATSELQTQQPPDFAWQPETVPQAQVSAPTRTQAAASPPRPGVNRWVLAAAGGAIALALLGVIIIKIVNKDGSVTELRVPDNATTIEVEKNGQSIGKVDVAQGKVNAPNGTLPTTALNESSAKERADQRAARWLRSIKASFLVRNPSGEVTEINATTGLPGEDYAIVRIDLQGCSDSVTDDGLSNLRGLKSLEYISLLGCQKVTNAGALHLADCTALKEAHLTFVPVTDQCVPAFLKMPGLSVLDLGETLIGDQGLAQLKPLINLEQITLGSASTDAGLAHLTAFPKLRFVGIKQHHVTELGAAHLGKLKSVQELYLVGATDVELKRLTALRGLRSLTLNLNTLTAAGMENIRAFPELETLNLANSQSVTDDHLADVSRLARIRVLYVMYTGVSDKGLASLGKLTDLKKLDVTSTKVTTAGIDKLHSSLPQCEIRWDGGSITPESRSEKGQ